MRNIREKLALKDSLEIWKNGELVLSNKDLIVNVGKAEVAKLIVNYDSPVGFTYIAIGTGTSTPAVTQVTLDEEITTGGGERASATITIEDSYIAQLEYTFDFIDSFDISELGVFNATAPNTGDMLFRQQFDAIPVVSGDSLPFKCRITIG